MSDWGRAFPVERGIDIVVHHMDIKMSAEALVEFFGDLFRVVDRIRVLDFDPGDSSLFWTEPSFAMFGFMSALPIAGARPDWDNDEEGLHTMLDSLLKFNPPSVLSVNDKVNPFSVLQFLLERRIWVPGDVSLNKEDTRPNLVTSSFVPERLLGPPAS